MFMKSTEKQAIKEAMLGASETEARECKYFNHFNF